MVVKEGLPGVRGRLAEALAEFARPCFRRWRCQHLQFAMNPRRTPQGIGNNHPFNPPANLDGCSGPASPTAGTFRSPRPESANPFSLPAGHGVSLDIAQRPPPTGPPAAESDPKHSIEGRQNGSLTFSLQGRELQSQGSIFDGDGLLTAQQ